MIGHSLDPTAALSRKGRLSRDSTEGAFTRFHQVLGALESAQKPGAGVPAYTRWVNRGLARYAAAAAASSGWSANAVSAVSALFSASALVVLVSFPPDPLAGVLAAGLLAFGYVLDSADGQVARVHGTGSPVGEWLDHVIDSVRVPAIHLAVAAGFLQLRGAGSWTLWIPVIYVLVAVCHFLSQILAEQLVRGVDSGVAPAVSTDREPGPLRSFLMLPTDPGAMCWIFLLWGFPQVFLIAYAIMLAANGTVFAASMIRKFRALSRLSSARTPS